jgi:hypothetical protein
LRLALGRLDAAQLQRIETALRSLRAAFGSAAGEPARASAGRKQDAR